MPKPMAKWAGSLVESDDGITPFPLAKRRELSKKHPDMERIDSSRPITSWRSAWRAAVKRAKLQLRFHDLRHTCVTKRAELQASEQTLMAIAGHVSRRIIEHYSHIRAEAKRAAVEAIAAPSLRSFVEARVNQNVNQVGRNDLGRVAKASN